VSTRNSGSTILLEVAENLRNGRESGRLLNHIDEAVDENAEYVALVLQVLLDKIQFFLEYEVLPLLLNCLPHEIRRIPGGERGCAGAGTHLGVQLLNTCSVSVILGEELHVEAGLGIRVHPGCLLHESFGCVEPFAIDLLLARILEERQFEGPPLVVLARPFDQLNLEKVEEGSGPPEF